MGISSRYMEAILALMVNAMMSAKIDHERRPHRHPDDHHKRVLNVHHIGGEPGHQTGR